MIELLTSFWFWFWLVLTGSVIAALTLGLYSGGTGPR